MVLGLVGGAAMLVDVTVLVLVGGAPGGETPRVADSSAAGAVQRRGPKSDIRGAGAVPRPQIKSWGGAEA